MSRASTMSTMGQQLSQSIGIGLAAVLLRLFMARAHATQLTGAVVAPVFMVIGVLVRFDPSSPFRRRGPEWPAEAAHGVRRRPFGVPDR